MGEEACYQSEGIKFIHPLFSLQNGRFASVKRSFERERFYVQGGPERCLLCVPLHRNHQKFLRFQWKGNIYEFLCLCFGLGPVPWIFAKLLKIPHCRFEADSNQNNNLSGRHVADEIDCKRSRNSQGYIDFSIAESGLINPQKSVLVPLQKIELLGLEIDSVRMTLTLPQEKVKKIETEMSKAYFKPQNDIMGND